MHMPEFYLSMMLWRDARIHHSDLWKKQFLKLTMDHILKHEIVGETSGGTPKILISYSGLGNSRKSMVNVNLVQNVQNTKNV